MKTSGWSGFPEAAGTPQVSSVVKILHSNGNASPRPPWKVKTETKQGVKSQRQKLVEGRKGFVEVIWSGMLKHGHLELLAQKHVQKALIISEEGEICLIAMKRRVMPYFSWVTIAHETTTKMALGTKLIAQPPIAFSASKTHHSQVEELQSAIHGSKTMSLVLSPLGFTY